MRLIPGLFAMLLWATAMSLTALFLVTRMLKVGLGVTPDALRDVVRARGVLVRALIANLVAVPILAVVLVTVLPLGADARLAILLLAVIPGGLGFASMRETPAGARTAVLVFLLSVIAVVITPALRVLVQPVGPPITTSVGRLLLISALGLLAPLLAGLAIRATAPAVADTVSRIALGLSAGLFVATLLSVVVVHGPLRVLGLLDGVALVLFAAGAAAIGWLAGGPDAPVRRDLARVTVLRNIGLCLLIALLAVPHGGVAVVIVAFVVVVVALRAVVAMVDSTRRRRVGVDHVVPSA
jgi:bile acid:Na+ symporter, BASS family